ncbi:putative cysteine protease [Tribonema minus]|uniref:Putative cysteine protease n=1 Tax=Tribonema minus TaxID=303371 RepID=A0A835Z1W7_9STRA|nr:putative cysteine protease [Tribonema minus]
MGARTIAVAAVVGVCLGVLLTLLYINRRRIYKAVAAAPPEDLPTYFKWKERFLVPVRNQKGCAACWALSVCDMMSDTINLRSGGQWGRNHLSPQYLISCWHDHQGCNVGGSPEATYDLPQLTEAGIPLEEEFPYTATDTAPCKAITEGVLRVRTIKNTGRDLCVDPATVPESVRQQVIDANIVRMKKALLNGPIVGTLRVHEDLYKYDGLAIYQVTPGSRQIGYHAVEVIGYCDESVNWAEPGFDDGYWVVRSSWGENWGARGIRYGFAYVKMGCNEADIESRASVCEVEMPESAKDAIAATDIDTMRYTSYTQYVEDPERSHFVGAMVKNHAKSL